MPEMFMDFDAERDKRDAEQAGVPMAITFKMFGLIWHVDRLPEMYVVDLLDGGNDPQKSATAFKNLVRSLVVEEERDLWNEYIRNGRPAVAEVLELPEHAGDGEEPQVKVIGSPAYPPIHDIEELDAAVQWAVEQQKGGGRPTKPSESSGSSPEQTGGTSEPTTTASSDPTPPA
jgi:hypothetical protein